MIHEKIDLTNKQADGYVIPLGPVNLVMIRTNKGLVGCGAFDVPVLDKFEYPAARVKSADGRPIAAINDVLTGIISQANESAEKLGIKPGMTGKEALEKM